VLAGGASQRFGAVDKLSEVHAGMPLLHHAVLRLAEVTGDVVVVLAPGAPEPPMPPGAPVRFARDALDAQGPLVGALAGLGAVDREMAVVAGGDMPGLSTPVILEMFRVAGEADVDAVILHDGERRRPLPMVVRPGRASEIGHAMLHRGERSLRRWLDAMRVAVIDEAAWTALDRARATLRDVDVAEDLDVGDGGP
jgi:molybdopterin-guanine dinucleotide biosynthesis protein A